MGVSSSAKTFAPLGKTTARENKWNFVCRTDSKLHTACHCLAYHRDPPAHYHSLQRCIGADWLRPQYHSNTPYPTLLSGLSLEPTAVKRVWYVQFLRGDHIETTNHRTTRLIALSSYLAFDGIRGFSVPSLLMVSSLSRRIQAYHQFDHFVEVMTILPWNFSINKSSIWQLDKPDNYDWLIRVISFSFAMDFVSRERVESGSGDCQESHSIGSLRSDWDLTPITGQSIRELRASKYDCILSSHRGSTPQVDLHPSFWLGASLRL